MESLHKSLREYFGYIDKHNVVMNDLIKTVSKPIDALKSLAEQHRAVAKAEVERLPLGRIPDIKEKLLFKIETAMDEEIIEIQKIIEECKTTNLVLEKKHVNVKKCLEKLGDLRTVEDRKALCSGTARYPSVLEMVEWVDDCLGFYRALYLKFSSITVIIQSEDDRRIAGLSKNYLHCEERKMFIERVLSMTKRFVDDT